MKNEASSEARNRAVLATSSGVPNRPIGVMAIAQRERLSSARSGAVMGVSMNPGPMAFTRIPCGASSWARALVSIHTPALLTL